MPVLKTSSSTRTIVADLAHLIKNKKISENELARIDSNLRAEAEQYATTLDDGFFDLQSMRLDASPSAENTGPFDLHQTKKTEGIIVQKDPPLRSSFQQPASADFSPSTAYATYTSAKFQPVQTQQPNAPRPAQKSKFANPIKVPTFVSSEKKSEVSKPDEADSFKSELEAELENEFTTTKKTSANISQSIKSNINTATFAPPVAAQQKVLSEREQLAHKVSELISKVDSILIEEKAAREYVENISAKLKENADYFSTVESQAKDLEKKETDVKEKEQLASTLKDRKMLEEERWAIEDQIQKIEDDRWQKNQEKISLEKDLTDRQINETMLIKKRENLEIERDKAIIQESALKAKDDIVIYQGKLDEVKAQKKKGEDGWQKQMQAKQKAASDLETNLKKQQQAKETIEKAVEEKRKAASEELRHIHEEKRRKGESDFRELEKVGWMLEESMEAMQVSLSELEAKFAQYQTEEEGLQAKIEELQAIIKKAHE